MQERIVRDRDVRFGHFDCFEPRVQVGSPNISSYIIYNYQSKLNIYWPLLFTFRLDYLYPHLMLNA